MATDYEKQLQTFITAAEAAGWTVTKTGSGHWRFLPPDPDAKIVIAPATSSDYRGADNVRADLRRSGLRT